VLDDLTENPLPASFELRVARRSFSPAQVRAIAAAAGPSVDEVQYGEEWVSAYENLLRMVVVWPGYIAVMLIAAGVAFRPAPVRGSTS
jgi:cell division protein FtsX